ncbi:MAG TPA: hypothetical protein VFR37_05480 [Longimicrobium sp.]|nr:hypothetical protein [Longimicrobium sp.]
MPVTFREAMEKLGAAVTNTDLVQRFGWKLWQLRQSRQRVGKPTRPILQGPPGWESALLQVARERRDAMAKLVEELEEAAAAGQGGTASKS